MKNEVLVPHFMPRVCSKSHKTGTLPHICTILLFQINLSVGLSWCFTTWLYTYTTRNARIQKSLHNIRELSVPDVEKLFWK